MVQRKDGVQWAVEVGSRIKIGTVGFNVLATVREVHVDFLEGGNTRHNKNGSGVETDIH